MMFGWSMTWRTAIAWDPLRSAAICPCLHDGNLLLEAFHVLHMALWNTRNFTLSGVPCTVCLFAGCWKRTNIWFDGPNHLVQLGTKFDRAKRFPICEWRPSSRAHPSAPVIPTFDMVLTARTAPVALCLIGSCLCFHEPFQHESPCMFITTMFNEFPASHKTQIHRSLLQASWPEIFLPNFATEVSDPWNRWNGPLHVFFQC